MQYIRKYVMGLILMSACLIAAGQSVFAAEPVIVVIDPGHGGENLGAEYEEYTEKEMTLAVAEAMKEELEKYEGIKVYMTREGDKDISLEERAEYAAAMNADMLYCLHFNMSQEHDKFGAEVWVSAFGEQYQKGYTFAAVELELLEQLGIYSRGIKTRLNDAGEDYYGIIRHATARKLTAVLIEHCHLDEENDKEFYNAGEKLEQLGRLDAEAVAKYYGLSSQELGIDYSHYQKEEIPIPSAPVKPDLSEPDICIIEAEPAKGNSGETQVLVSAQDYDGSILYYSYSYDGGENYSSLQRWEAKEGDSMNFKLELPSGIVPEIVVRVYNGYDRVTESNHVLLPSVADKETVEAISMQEQGGIPDSIGVRVEQPAADEMKLQTEPEDTLIQKASEGSETKKEITFIYFLQVSLVSGGLLLILLLAARIIVVDRSAKKRQLKKKRRRKK